MKMMLRSSELAVGHCVIVNKADRPHGRLVAVITDVNDGVFSCNYLNADSRLSTFNAKLGMLMSACDITPVAHFGADVLYDPETNLYQCVRVRGSVATYADGAPRRWQEYEPMSEYDARPQLAELCLSVACGR